MTTTTPTPPHHQDGDTPLMRASYNGHRDCADLLLTRKAEVDQQDKVTRGEGWEVAPMVLGADACIIDVTVVVLWCGFRIWVSESDVNVSVVII